ncbi:MAG: MFS transporter [Actinomycetota bacterium]|nr:MFS transporter [Actinomycetota bacterium]MDQ2957100.1 MFS transporter [Actinomycetota bacterium]
MSSDTLHLRGAGPARAAGFFGGRINRASLVLAVILSCQLMVVLDSTIVNVALPDMKSALHFSNAQLSWVLNAYTLTFGGLLLLGARAGDLLGRRVTFLVGIGIFTAASLVGGFATAGWFLLAARALQGVGGALAAPSSLALLATMFPEGRERLRAIALFTAVSIGGGAIGLICGGMLTQWASWRWVLFVNVPIGIVVYAIGRAVLPETERHHGRFDFGGALTSTLGMGSLVYGLVRAATAGWSDSVTLGSLIVGVLLLAAFIGVELRAEEPITPLRLLANASRSGANVARGLVFAGMFGMFFFLTQFLQNVLGYSPLQTGFAFLPIPLTVFASSQLASRVLVHRVNGKLLMLVGVGLSTIGMFGASRLGADSSYPAILACLLLFGAGNGLSFVTVTSAALAGVAPEDAGAASGLINVTQQLGGTLGVAALVTVFGSASKHALAHPGSGVTGTRLANEVFVYAADRAFVAGTLFLVVALVIVAAAVRAPRPARAPRPVVRDEPVLVGADS